MLTAKSWWRHQMETFSALLAVCGGFHRSPVNSPHKGQWRGTLMFSLICAWINRWVNNWKVGDLRRHRAHYDVTVILHTFSTNSRWLLTIWGDVLMAGWGSSKQWLRFREISRHFDSKLWLSFIMGRISPSQSSLPLIGCTGYDVIIILRKLHWRQISARWSKITDTRRFIQHLVHDIIKENIRTLNY